MDWIEWGVVIAGCVCAHYMMCAAVICRLTRRAARSRFVYNHAGKFALAWPISLPLCVFFGDWESEVDDQPKYEHYGLVDDNRRDGDG